MKYFRLTDDLHDRWFLRDLVLPESDSIWRYLTTGKIDSVPYNLSIDATPDGDIVDFTFAEFDLIIVNEKCKQLFPSGEVDFFPILITGRETHGGQFYVMTIREGIDCLDENNSSFDFFLPDDPIRPDLAGEYRGIYNLKIDTHKTGEAEIFRMQKYEVAVIVNEKLKNRLRKNYISGIRFLEV